MTDELCWATATALADMVRRREVSATELLEAHLDRIARVNPRLGALVTLDPDGARAAARRADDLTARGLGTGPLHGLPAAHKDTHLTGGLRTTFGSPLRAGYVPRDDELVVARLAAAGAVRVGKTNVPEFAAGSHTTNPLFGPTLNPWAHGLSAGGSSGGAAAALAAGLVPVAEGSDMGGSLRNPAAFCGVAGLRPSAGRVPTHPAALGWTTLSVQGPMGRTVADVALVLAAVAGPDPRVPVSLDDPPGPLAAPLPTDLRGRRIAWAPDLGGRVPLEPAVREALERQRGVLEHLGATVVDDCPDLRGADEVFRTLRAWIFATQLGEVVRRSPERVKGTVRWDVGRGEALSGPDLARAEVLRTRLHERVVAFFGGYDALACATTQVLPFDVDVEWPREVAGVPQDDYLGWMRSCTLVSATGCPAASVPVGMSAPGPDSPAGLPVGLQVVGAPRADRTVLEVAAAVESAAGNGWRRPPVG